MSALTWLEDFASEDGKGGIVSSLAALALDPAAMCGPKKLSIAIGQPTEKGVRFERHWIPAFAGMTKSGVFRLSKRHSSLTSYFLKPNHLATPAS